MRVFVTFEAESVSKVIAEIHNLPLEVISITEQVVPAQPKPVYRSTNQDQVADAVRSQIAPAVTSE